MPGPVPPWRCRASWPRCPLHCPLRLLRVHRLPSWARTCTPQASSGEVVDTQGAQEPEGRPVASLGETTGKGQEAAGKSWHPCRGTRQLRTGLPHRVRARGHRLTPLAGRSRLRVLCTREVSCGAEPRGCVSAERVTWASLGCWGLTLCPLPGRRGGDPDLLGRFQLMEGIRPPGLHRDHSDTTWGFCGSACGDPLSAHMEGPPSATQPGDVDRSSDLSHAVPSHVETGRGRLRPLSE